MNSLRVCIVRIKNSMKHKSVLTMNRLLLMFVLMLGIFTASFASAQVDCSEEIRITKWQYGDFGQFREGSIGKFGGHYGARSEAELLDVCRERHDSCYEEYRTILDAIFGRSDSADLERKAVRQLEQCKRHYSIECEDAAAQICLEADKAGRPEGEVGGLGHNMVRRAQVLLSQLGYDPGPIDGIFGDLTQDALDAFLRKHPTKDDFRPLGHVNREVLALLEATAADRQSDDPATALTSRCSELPGSYLGLNDAQCWEEFENRPGCHWWNDHYHPDRTARWSGECHAGFAEGHGTHLMSSGSEHDSWEQTGTFLDGRMHGHWTIRWGDGTTSEGPYVDGKWHGRWIIRHADGEASEGPYVDHKRHGRWTSRSSEGDVYEVSYVHGKPQSQTVRLASGTVLEGPLAEPVNDFETPAIAIY